MSYFHWTSQIGNFILWHKDHEPARILKHTNILLSILHIFKRYVHRGKTNLIRRNQRTQYRRLIFYIYGSKYCPLMHKYPDFFIFVNLFLYGRLFNEAFKHLFVIRSGWKISNQFVYMTRNAPKVPHRTVKFSWIIIKIGRHPKFSLIYQISVFMKPFK